MKSHRIAIAVTLLTLALGSIACAPPPGVSEADHNRVLDQLDKCRKDQEAANRKLKDMEGEAARQVLAERKAILEQLERELAGLIEAGSLRIQVRRGLLVVQMDESLLFASGQAEVTGGGKTVLAKVSSSLKGIENRRFLVAGHTDDVPTRKDSAFKSNWELSTARAQSVVYVMRKNDVPAAMLAVAGFGSTDPVASNADDAGRKANRRTELIILPDLAKLLQGSASGDGQ